MGAKQEAVVREFCDLWGQGGEVPAIDKIVAMFAEDGVWQLWVPGGPTIKGRDAIKAEIERQITFSTFMECGLLDIASNDRVVYTERLDHFTMGGKRISHALTAVYELDDDGLITAWREYFDTADLAQQLGIAPEDLAQA
jgi:limonene-1,2-epoxide hydrolase